MSKQTMIWYFDVLHCEPCLYAKTLGESQAIEMIERIKYDAKHIATNWLREPESVVYLEWLKTFAPKTCKEVPTFFKTILTRDPKEFPGMDDSHYILELKEQLDILDDYMSDAELKAIDSKSMTLSQIRENMDHNIALCSAQKDYITFQEVILYLLTYIVPSFDPVFLKAVPKTDTNMLIIETIEKTKQQLKNMCPCCGLPSRCNPAGQVTLKPLKTMNTSAETSKAISVREKVRTFAEQEEVFLAYSPENERWDREIRVALERGKEEKEEEVPFREYKLFDCNHDSWDRRMENLYF